MYLSVMNMNAIHTHVIVKNICYLQIAVGISASTVLLLLHIFMFLEDGRVKAAELITCHLALIHIVMLLVALEFLSPDMFESLNLENDFKCKALFYVSRVMRGLSICTTCFLSVLQAITISPRTSWMVKAKHALTSYTIHIFLFFWLLNLFFSSGVILYAVAYSNRSQTNLLAVSEHCSLNPTTFITRRLFFILTLSRDVFFVGLMLFSSAYMVVLLFWHHRRSLHLQRCSLSARYSPEQRATQTTLILVSVFVLTYWVNLIISSRSTLLWIYEPVLLNLQKLVLNAYATVCPVTQMTFQKRIHDIMRLMCWKFHILEGE
ncbi:putative vomeronasal receptor-like protein 4 [Acomys russatus]|uniref:putative vomeronasal receptor-like protein 4 n=1 Tax=Acomys russatus TaxID=60746 RepID=UPI0021E247BB|nr:putative vomeronasal receptor-like protein 4 [Acomys russatus]